MDDIVIGDAPEPALVNEEYTFTIKREGTEFEVTAYPKTFADNFGMKMCGVMLGKVADFLLVKPLEDKDA